MDNIRQEYLNEARDEVLKRYPSAHERLAVSQRVEEALGVVAFYGCEYRIGRWALVAYQHLGGKLSDYEQQLVASTMLASERRKAIEAGEQASLIGLLEEDHRDVAYWLDSAARDAFRKDSGGEVFAVFRAKWHASNGTPDAELVPIIRWALQEVRHAATWDTCWHETPKGTRTRKRNELIDLLSQTQARLERSQTDKLKHGGVRVGKPARELGAILAAYAEAAKQGKGWELRRAAPALIRAIEESEAWVAFTKGDDL
jgi:hypothetical protein